MVKILKFDFKKTLYLLSGSHRMLKKVSIFLWIASAVFSYAVLLTLIYSDIVVSYAKFFGTIIPLACINISGVIIWRKIQ